MSAPTHTCCRYCGSVVRKVDAQRLTFLKRFVLAANGSEWGGDPNALYTVETCSRACASGFSALVCDQETYETRSTEAWWRCPPNAAVEGAVQRQRRALEALAQHSKELGALAVKRNQEYACSCTAPDIERCAC